MGDLMIFPDTVEEFMEQYKMIDTEQIYSNGTEYVPIFRMKQWFEHLPAAESEIIRCKDCKHKPYRSVGHNGKPTITCSPPNDETCPFLCDDPCYDKVPPDDFFCAYGERKDD